MPKKKPYHHNNWQLYKDSDDSMFIPHEFNEFMDWKLGGWELPSSVKCIIRETNLSTGKVKEYTYSRHGDAQNKIDDILKKGESEFVVCDEEEIHYLYPKHLDDDDDSTV